MDFFADGVKIGEATKAPYCITWTNMSPCSYDLIAQATDDSGRVGYSLLSDVTIVSPSQPARLIQAYSRWRFRVDGQDLGAAWRLADYDDSDWQIAFGEFGNSSRSPTFIPWQLTTYFRREFDWQDSGAFTNLQTIFYARVGEGAVFYLNGVEIFRTRMPAGDIAFSTVPVSDAPPLVNPDAIELLRPGENVLAVEVHRF